MSAKVTRIREYHFQGWCTECCDGINHKSKAKAQTWADDHNEANHQETP